MRRVRRTTLIATTVALLFTACSTDDRSSTTGTLAPAVEEAVWRQVPAAPDLSGVSTSVAGVAVTDEVRAAFDWLVLGRVHCGRRPRDCIVDALAVPGSPVHTTLVETFADRVRHGIVASDQGSHRHRIADVVMLADDRAEVRSCHTDDIVLMISGSNGRPAAIYDESLVSHWSTWTMRRTDEGWRWTDEAVDARIYGEDRCEW
jgi:hypothetical protein